MKESEIKGTPPWRTGTVLQLSRMGHAAATSHGHIVKERAYQSTSRTKEDTQPSLLLSGGGHYSVVMELE